MIHSYLLDATVQLEINNRNCTSIYYGVIQKRLQKRLNLHTVTTILGDLNRCDCSEPIKINLLGARDCKQPPHAPKTLIFHPF
jgi:hypothetical protein